MKSSQGYCYAYRKAWYHPAFNNLREAAIWNFLYQNAFYEDGESNINGHTFHLKRGQIAVTTSFIAKGFGMTDKGVRVVIQKLIKLGMLGVQGTSRGSIITICNYNTYQRKEKTEGELKGKQRANRGQTEGNNNNEDNEDNEDKIDKVDKYKPGNVSKQIWGDFKKLRQKKRAPITETVIDQIIKQAGIAKYTMEDALQECCVRGWSTFKAEWVNKNNKPAKQSIHKDERETIYAEFK